MIDTEKKLWNSLKPRLPKKKTHVQRIENRVSEGMPDCYLCLDGVPVWLELKVTKSDKVRISKSQIAWNLAHSRCNGVSFFLVYRPEQGDAFLFEGGKALEIQDSRIEDVKSGAVYHGGLDGVACALRPAALGSWNIVE